MRDFGRPAVLKTCELGYDGKGQVLLDGTLDAGEAWERMTGHNPESLGVLEAFVEFHCEISVIAARSLKGQIQTYVPVENQHRAHILDAHGDALCVAGQRKRSKERCQRHFPVDHVSSQSSMRWSPWA